LLDQSFTQAQSIGAAELVAKKVTTTTGVLPLPSAGPQPIWLFLGVDSDFFQNRF
jgi:hypothetical protein